MNIPQTLRAAKSLIETPNTWAKGARAKNHEGRDCPVMASGAMSFCSKGALLRIVGSEDADIAVYEDYLELGTTWETPTRLNYIGYNELHTHREVMAMWDKAISLAEQDASIVKHFGEPTPTHVLLEQVGV